MKISKVMGNIQVKSIDMVEVKELLKTCPKLVKDYVNSLERCYEMSRQTNKMAIRKIRELSNGR